MRLKSASGSPGICPLPLLPLPLRPGKRPRIEPPREGSNGPKGSNIFFGGISNKDEDMYGESDGECMWISAIKMSGELLIGTMIFLITYILYLQIIT